MSSTYETIPLDLYKILNLSSKATRDDIKQSFRKLSLQYHPDKDSNSTEEYKKILMAYEHLSDINKKNIYDLQINSTNRIDNDNNMIKFYANNSELSQPNELNTNIYLPETIYTILEITLNQAFLGCILPMEIEKNVEYNKLRTKELETIYITVPEGIDNNEIIIIKNKGNSINNILIGDIKIQIKIKKDDYLIRKGLDLIYKKAITLKEALCGFTFTINHINKKIYTIRNDGSNTIKDQQEQIISNLGIKRDNYIGDLIIIFSIIYPNQLSLNQKTKLREIL